MPKYFLSQYAVVTAVLCLLVIAFTGPVHARGYYTGRLTDVIGDVKQGQIQNKLDSKAKVDNVLSAMEKLGCNGIRITIFPAGANPNPEMFDYLYQQAKKKGFKIFANPAQHAGAQRLANLDIDKPGGVKNKLKPTQILIDHVWKFAQKYPCDWINPFNEDGKPGNPWTGPQMEFIYQKLYGNVNGAKLVGPCTWGIPNGITVLSKTRIAKYISVATTHNLGYNHESWPEFVRLARRLRLPVWDSEVNMHKKYPDKPHRLDAALAVEVDGLVLYHAWKSFMNLNTGRLNNTGKRLRRMILVDENQPPPLVSPREKSGATASKYKPVAGDILFQSTSQRRMFDVLEGESDSRYSHCGILVRKRGKWFVLEAADVVKETPIQQWIGNGRNKSYVVYRLKGTSRSKISKWISQARKFADRPYDTRYELGDEAIYNSELVYTSFKLATGKELATPVPLGDLQWKKIEKFFVESEGSIPLKRKVVTPQQISESNELEQVYSSKK